METPSEFISYVAEAASFSVYQVCISLSITRRALYITVGNPCCRLIPSFIQERFIFHVLIEIDEANEGEKDLYVFEFC
jgi:hypothetical protein